MGELKRELREKVNMGIMGRHGRRHKGDMRGGCMVELKS